MSDSALTVPSHPLPPSLSAVKGSTSESPNSCYVMLCKRHKQMFWPVHLRGKDACDLNPSIQEEVIN